MSALRLLDCRRLAVREFGTPRLRCGVVPGRIRPRRAGWALAAVACGLTAVVSVAACGRGGGGPRDGLAADTARFTYDGRRVEVPLTACGREGDVVVLAGARGRVVVQAVVDLGEGGVARSGVTADLGGEDGIWGAFGAEVENGPAGEITDLRVEGDRVVVEGRWTRFDGDLNPQPIPVDQLAEGRLVARCPENDTETA
jgi:hypothetical protein